MNRGEREREDIQTHTHTKCNSFISTTIRNAPGMNITVQIINISQCTQDMKLVDMKEPMLHTGNNWVQIAMEHTTVAISFDVGQFA